MTADTTARARRRRNSTLETMAEAMSVVAIRRHEDELSSARRSVGRNEDYLVELGERIRSTHAKLGRDRAQLRLLEENPPVGDIAAATEELRFIRSLPGVRAVTANDAGEIVVSISTACMYKGKRYDLGDYDIILPWMRSANQGFRLVCTRSGLKSKEVREEPRDPCGRDYCPQCRTTVRLEYAHPFYWTVRDGRDDSTGPGSFCFGGGRRSQQITELWKQNRYGELVHMLIATMCNVNDDHWSSLPGVYNSSRLRARQRRNWRFGRPQSDIEAGV